MNSQISGNKNQTNDLMRVLQALKRNIERSINCSEVALVKSVSNNVIRCSTLSENLMLECIALKDMTINENDVVLIVFTNSDFRQALKKLQLGQSTSQSSQSENLHSKNYGIIIGKL